MHRNPKRQIGGAAMILLFLLLLVGSVLGLNYVRNLQIDQKAEKKSRPYARYKLADLEILAQGYREEVATAEKRLAGNRVATRERHHFSDQIDEFERVQKAARKARDKALAAAELKRELEAIEAEKRLRGAGQGAGVHLTRLFRL